MAMILTSFYVGKKESFWLTFAIIASTDRIIGNSWIFLFTWSGFLIPAILASNLLKTLKHKLKLKLVLLLGVGLSSNIFFFLWTNFGVWLLDSWHMYPNTLNGLFLSYINAIPFLKMQAISTLIFIPTGFFIIEATKNLIVFFKPRIAPKLT
jgi:hypothetical protein